MKTIILGCFLFKGQGTQKDVSISTIDGVKIFKTTDEAEQYGEVVLNNGGDSYFIYNEELKIRWGGNKKLFNKLYKEAIFNFKSEGDIEENEYY